MPYIVIKDFTDLQDNGKLYEENNTFPRPANKKVSKKRLEELSGENNRRKEPLIKEVVEEQE